MADVQDERILGAETNDIRERTANNQNTVDHTESSVTDPGQTDLPNDSTVHYHLTDVDAHPDQHIENLPIPHVDDGTRTIRRSDSQSRHRLTNPMITLTPSGIETLFQGITNHVLPPPADFADETNNEPLEGGAECVTAQSTGLSLDEGALIEETSLVLPPPEPIMTSETYEIDHKIKTDKILNVLQGEGSKNWEPEELGQNEVTESHIANESLRSRDVNEIYEAHESNDTSESHKASDTQIANESLQSTSTLLDPKNDSQTSQATIKATETDETLDTLKQESGLRPHIHQVIGEEDDEMQQKPSEDRELVLRVHAAPIVDSEASLKNDNQSNAVFKILSMDTDIIKAQIKEYLLYGDYSNKATIEKYKVVTPALIDLIARINKHDERCIKKRKAERGLGVATTFGVHLASSNDQDGSSETQVNKKTEMSNHWKEHLTALTLSDDFKLFPAEMQKVLLYISNLREDLIEISKTLKINSKRGSPTSSTHLLSTKSSLVKHQKAKKNDPKKVLLATKLKYEKDIQLVRKENAELMATIRRLRLSKKVLQTCKEADKKKLTVKIRKTRSAVERTSHHLRAVESEKLETEIVLAELKIKAEAEIRALNAANEVEINKYKLKIRAMTLDCKAKDDHVTKLEDKIKTMERRFHNDLVAMEIHYKGKLEEELRNRKWSVRLKRTLACGRYFENRRTEQFYREHTAHSQGRTEEF
ncbi:myosin-2 heavy chain-like [Clytia hemisphaerica]|uniref:Uncharacterized protein n=1 Tax=Clytia hemisphaerica TaxID=252671 RepID=A0A7M6DP05_9CNID